MAQTGQNAALAAPATGGVSRTHPAAGVTRILDARDGRIEFLMPDGVTPRKKIALCGFAQSTKDMAPYDDPDWAIVGMNQLNRHIPRADAWFEIHKVWNTALVPDTDHEGWIRDCGIPVFMTDDAAARKFPQTWVRFPIERLIGRLGHDYFTSTVAHMVAWAIDYIDARVEAQLRSEALLPVAVKASRKAPLPVLTAWDVVQRQRALYQEWSIGIYGVDLVVGEEYFYQKPCAEYYCGQVMARDITLNIPQPSALLKQRYRYGYQMEPDETIKDSDLEARRVALVNEHQKRTEESLLLAGSINEINRMKELRALRERGAQIGIL